MNTQKSIYVYANWLLSSAYDINPYASGSGLSRDGCFYYSFISLASFIIPGRDKNTFTVAFENTFFSGF